MYVYISLFRCKTSISNNQLTYRSSKKYTDTHIAPWIRKPHNTQYDRQFMHTNNMFAV